MKTQLKDGDSGCAFLHFAYSKERIRGEILNY